MAVEFNQSSIYTVKCLDEDGYQKFIDVPALGTSDAQDKFKALYPQHQLLSITRKQ